MRSEPFRFFVFTCRDPRSDFRLPLVDALRRDFETYYVWLRRRPLVCGPRRGDAMQEMPLTAFLQFMRGFRRDERINVYFNSTNTYFPAMSMLLRGMMPKGIWCLDLHDDLRYHNTGLKWWREGQIVALLRRMSDVTVHAAPTLRELFPDSRHLGNASNLGRLSHAGAPDHEILIIASFDARFDFGLIGALAALCPELRFHLHGWTRPDDHATRAAIAELADQHANVHYHGAYSTADLPEILSRYRITVAPYKVDSPLTRYIDPLRFYHCLNAGQEVVSTPIPQAQYMASWVHLARDAAACAAAIAGIRAGKLAKQPDYTPITWEQRADQLVEIIAGLPQTAHLAQRRQGGIRSAMTT